MAQQQKVWVEVEEFMTMAAQLIEKYPERFSEIDLDRVAAYMCVNKERPEKSTKPYDMSGATTPESLTNSKTYCIKMYQEVWDRTLEQKLALVFSALSRIDPTNPGKVKSLDYSDQAEMVDSLGANWHERGNLPNLLKQDISSRT